MNISSTVRILEDYQDLYTALDKTILCHTVEFIIK